MSRWLAWIGLAAGVVWIYAHEESFPSNRGSGRIVSVVPSSTEWIYEIGAEDKLVGVTTYCRYPEAARKKEKIGDLVVDYEKILALRPEFVVSSESMVPRTNETLRRLGIEVIAYDPATFEEIAETLRDLGRRFGCDGETPARRLMERVRAVEARVRGKPAPTVYFEMSADPICSPGPETYAGDVIRRAGGRNILEGGWTNDLQWEFVLARDPDVIVIAHGHGEGPALRPGWAELRAVREGRVYYVDGDHFVVPTSRLAQGLEELAEILHARE